MELIQQPEVKLVQEPKKVHLNIAHSRIKELLTIKQAFLLKSLLQLLQARVGRQQLPQVTVQARNSSEADNLLNLPTILG